MHIYAHFTASVDPLPALLKNNEYLPPMRAFPGPAARLQQLFQRFTACTTIRCVLTRVHRSLSILADARPDRLCVPANVCLLLLSCLLLQGTERFAWPQRVAGQPLGRVASESAQRLSPPRPSPTPDSAPIRHSNRTTSPAAPIAPAS